MDNKKIVRINELFGSLNQSEVIYATELLKAHAMGREPEIVKNRYEQVVIDFKTTFDNLSDARDDYVDCSDEENHKIYSQAMRAHKACKDRIVHLAGELA